MPHGSFDMTYATPGISIGGSSDWPPVLGLSSGGMTSDEREKVNRANAIKTIEHWETLSSTAWSTAAERRAAEMAVYDAIWPYQSKGFVFNAKRYKAVSRAKGLSVRVTPVEEKKPRKKPSNDEPPFQIF